MDEAPRDDLIHEISTVLREPVELDPELDFRILARLQHTRVSLLRLCWNWLREPSAVRLSPLAALGAAASVAIVTALLLAVPRAPSSGMAARASDDGARQRVEFVLAAPGASEVAIAGDFNDWNGDSSPLIRTSEGVWTITVPLTPGRYRYTFLVNGRRWVGDPEQPPAMGDDFGVQTSVITVASR